MARKQGLWVKPREPHKLSPEGKAAIRPQTEKIRAAGLKIKERCAGKSGSEFKQCRSQVLRELFGKPASKEGK
jgi:hypothetical protein